MSEFASRIIMNYETSCLCYLFQPLASASNADLGFDN